MALVKFTLSGIDIYVAPDKVVLLVQAEANVTDIVLASTQTLNIPLPIAQVAAAIDAGM